MSEPPPMRFPRSAVGLVCAVLTSGAPALAGGMHIVRSRADSEIIDITDEVKRNCTVMAERITPDGVVLQVLHAPGTESLAADGLEMMERLHAMLTTSLGLRVRIGARLYLVQSQMYPPSLKVVDKSSLLAVFALLNPGWQQSSNIYTLEHSVYSTLAHEWAHIIYSELYRGRSPHERSRWINDGIASYVQYKAVRELSPSGYDDLRRIRLPFLNLSKTERDSLIAWDFARRVPPREPFEESMRFYGAALGLFLRVEERGGAIAVTRFLDRLVGRGRVQKDELESALRRVVGSDYATLARMSPEEVDATYSEALTSLNSETSARQAFGLAVLEHFPGRFASHKEVLISLVVNPKTLVGISAKAALLAVGQGPAGTSMSLWTQLRGATRGIPQERVELPLLLGLSKELPACGLPGLARLARSTDTFTAKSALARIQEIAGRRLSVQKAQRWVDAKQLDVCPQPQ